MQISVQQNRLLESQDWPDLRRRLFYYALKRQKKLGIPESLICPEAIVHTAIEKTFAGIRPWKSNSTPLYAHLAGVVKSLYSNEFKKMLNRQAWEEAENERDEHVLHNLEDFIHLKQTFQLLRSHRPDLADFFVKATCLLLAGDCSTDVEVASELGISPSSYNERRKKIGEIVNSWQGAVSERPNGARGV